MAGERRQDGHIVIPDGIDVVEPDDPRANVRLVLSPEVKEEALDVDVWHAGWGKAAVTGTVVRDADGMAIDVTRWRRLLFRRRTAHPEELHRAFPWVSGTAETFHMWTVPDRSPTAWRPDGAPGSRQQRLWRARTKT